MAKRERESEKLKIVFSLQELRTKWEQELATVKKTLEEETYSHEVSVAEMRHKYSQELAVINEQMEALKKVRRHLTYVVFQ